MSFLEVVFIYPDIISFCKRLLWATCLTPTSLHYTNFATKAGKCLAFVRGSGTHGLLDGLQRPDGGEEITGLSLVALRGDSDVLHVVCGRYGRMRRGGYIRGRRGRNSRVGEGEGLVAHGLACEE